MFHKLYKKVLPDACCLCDESGFNGLDLCEKCYNCLPHNRVCCLKCAIPLSQENSLCGNCITEAGHIDHAIIPFLYRPPVDYMIKRLKFSADIKYSRLAGDLLSAAVRARQTGPIDVLVPVPIHRERLLERGFNQAEMVSRSVSKRLDVPLSHSLVRRSSMQLPQSSLSAREREANIRRAFVVEKNCATGLRVAIVDDVYTTGATARAIARQFHKAGAQEISIFAFARTP